MALAQEKFLEVVAGRVASHISGKLQSSPYPYSSPDGYLESEITIGESLLFSDEKQVVRDYLETVCDAILTEMQRKNQAYPMRKAFETESELSSRYAVVDELAPVVAMIIDDLCVQASITDPVVVSEAVDASSDNEKSGTDTVILSITVRRLPCIEHKMYWKKDDANPE